MWYPATFVDENVAFGPLPREEILDELSRDFGAVMIIVEGFELPYSLDKWKKRGIEVFHFPIPDFSAPCVEKLLDALKWIEDMVRARKRVLIHCVGDCGRSGTVAVAWLMYSQDLAIRQALSAVRKLRHCAVETESQIRVLRELERTLRTR